MNPDRTDVLGPLAPVSGLAESATLDPGQAIGALFRDCSDESEREAATLPRPMNSTVVAGPACGDADLGLTRINTRFLS